MKKKIIQITYDYITTGTGDHYRTFTVGASSPELSKVVDEIIPFERNKRQVIKSVLVRAGDIEIEVGNLHTKTWGPLDFGIKEEADGED